MSRHGVFLSATSQAASVASGPAVPQRWPLTTHGLESARGHAVYQRRRQRPAAGSSDYSLGHGGARRTEISLIKVWDIDSQRMMFSVERGMGGSGRDISLSPALLVNLREYWHWKDPV